MYWRFNSFRVYTGSSMKTRSDLEYLGYIWLGTVFLYTHNTTIFNVHYMILYEPQSAMT